MLVNEKKNNIYIKELDALRFVAILFVIVNHLGIKGDLYTWVTVVHSTSPVMACISSYLLFRSIHHPLEIGSKLKSRLRSLILPYFLWTLISFVIFQAVRTYGYFSNSNILGLKKWAPDWSFLNYWNNFVIIPNPSAFWYLQNVILILPFCFIIYFLLKPKWSLLFILPIILIAFDHHSIPYFSVRFLPYYIFGAWLGIHYPTQPPVMDWDRYSLLIILILLLVLNESVSDSFGVFKLVVEFCLQVGIFIVGLSVVRLFRNTLVVEYFYNKMHLSFYLHASHMLVIGIIGTVIVATLNYLNISVFGNIYFRVVCPFVVLLGTYRCIELLADQMMRKTPIIFSALSGGRHSQ